MALDTIARTKSNSSNFTRVNITSEPQVALEKNDNREDILVYNDSNRPLLISFTGEVSQDEFTIKVLPGGYYESGATTYTGDVHILWLDGEGEASGKALITELEG